jgi:hypothetical protein
MKWLTMLKREFMEFCATATIHGLHNVANERNQPLLRLLWMVIAITSFILSGISIKHSLEGNINVSDN